MTALKPIENVTHVRGVASKRYPPNKVCAHPECDKPVESIHHIFGRVPPETDSWFVKINDLSPDAIPHAIGLCGSGTTGHHGDLEEHRAWIKLEDGEFVWYDSGVLVGGVHPIHTPLATAVWTRLGPLNPQPGSREGKPKRKKHKGEARRKRTVLSIKVPNDEQERGGEVWDELIQNVRDKLGAVLREPGEASGPDERPVYFVLVDALNDWLTD